MDLTPLIFSQEVIDMVYGYIKCIRPRFNPTCRFLLVTKNGTQLTRLGDVFGRMVFQAIGKVFTSDTLSESAEKLSTEEQTFLSEDQKHTSAVAQVHYKKLQSITIAKKGKQAMDKLRNEEPSTSKVKEINLLTKVWTVKKLTLISMIVISKQRNELVNANPKHSFQI